MQISLRDDQVFVQAGVLHGHYHTYKDKKTGRKHLVIALCTDQRSVLDFGHQMPYNMNVVPDGAFRSYAKDHILVHRNIDHDVAAPKTQRPAHDEDGVMRWIEDFVYMHPGKPETSVRIGISEANEFKVSRNRETVTGNWDTYTLLQRRKKQTLCTESGRSQPGLPSDRVHDKESCVRIYSDDELLIL